MASRKLRPIHPGAILKEEYLEPMGVSIRKLAGDLSVPAQRLYDIVAGRREVCADTALRLARYFGSSPQFWLNLQIRYDLETAQDAIGPRLDKEVRIGAA